MNDPVMFRQLSVIQQIIADEAWLESERRGCPVPPEDPVVREKVCEVILRVGAALRETLLRETATRRRRSRWMIIRRTRRRKEKAGSAIPPYSRANPRGARVPP